MIFSPFQLTCQSYPFLQNYLYSVEVKTIYNKTIKFLQTVGSLNYLGSQVVESVQFQVHDLQPGKSYQVEVTASSMHAKSEPIIIMLETHDIPEEHAAETRLKDEEHDEDMTTVIAAAAVSAAMLLVICLLLIISLIWRKQHFIARTDLYYSARDSLDLGSLSGGLAASGEISLNDS